MRRIDGISVEQKTSERHGDDTNTLKHQSYKHQDIDEEANQGKSQLEGWKQRQGQVTNETSRNGESVQRNGADLGGETRTFAPMEMM